MYNMDHMTKLSNSAMSDIVNTEQEVQTILSRIPKNTGQNNDLENDNWNSYWNKSNVNEGLVNTSWGNARNTDDGNNVSISDFYGGLFGKKQVSTGTKNPFNLGKCVNPKFDFTAQHDKNQLDLMKTCANQKRAIDTSSDKCFDKDTYAKYPSICNKKVNEIGMKKRNEIMKDINLPKCASLDNYAPYQEKCDKMINDYYSGLKKADQLHLEAIKKEAKREGERQKINVLTQGLKVDPAKIKQNKLQREQNKIATFETKDVAYNCIKKMIDSEFIAMKNKNLYDHKREFIAKIETPGSDFTLQNYLTLIYLEAHINKKGNFNSFNDLTNLSGSVKILELVGKDNVRKKIAAIGPNFDLKYCSDPITRNILLGMPVTINSAIKSQIQRVKMMDVSKPTII